MTHHQAHLFLIVLYSTFILYIWTITSYKKTILYRNVIWTPCDPLDKPSKIPYLIRYTLLSCKFFTIKIHKALISDPDEPHDHPWNYLSIILRGGYWEEIPSPSPSYRIRYNRYVSPFMTRTWYKPGSILYRKGDRLHKLIIPEGKYCISLIFTFKRWRKWGYLKDGVWKQYHIQ